MEITRFDLLIDSDNTIHLTGLKDNDTGSYINDATPVEMSLFRLAARRPVFILTPNAQATGGTWTLSYLGSETTALAYNATMAEIQAALELLTGVRQGDITLSGQLISAGTGGLVIEFVESFREVDPVTFDFSDITGPTQAASTIIKRTQGLFSGDVIDKTGGKVGIPVIRHEAASGDFIKIEGAGEQLDGEYTVDATTSADEIVVTAVFADVSQTLTGRERLYIGIVNGTEIPMSYVSESDGNYKGILPYTLQGLIANELIATSHGNVEIGTYPLFATAVMAGQQKVWQRLGVAKFS